MSKMTKQEKYLVLKYIEENRNYYPTTIDLMLIEAISKTMEFQMWLVKYNINQCFNNLFRR